jgi:hypothetical protein
MAENAKTRETWPGRKGPLDAFSSAASGHMIDPENPLFAENLGTVMLIDGILLPVELAFNSNPNPGIVSIAYVEASIGPLAVLAPITTAN